MRKLTRLLGAVVGVLSLLPVPADAGGNTDFPQPPAKVDGRALTATASAPALAVRRVPGKPGRKAAVKVRCTYYHVPDRPEFAPGWVGPPYLVPPELGDWEVVEAGEPTVLQAPVPAIGELVVVRYIPPGGGTFLKICRRPDGTEVFNQIVEIGPQEGRSTPQWLAEHDVDWDDVPLPEPTVGPPKPTATFRTWFAVTDWEPVRATAEITNLVVEVEATPVSTRWWTGEGLLGCAGAGSRYDPALAPTGQDNRCVHRYKRSSYSRGPGDNYRAEVLVTYEVRW
ncbi:MAG: hypothetical protein ACRD0M_10735, partial [Acidimicrobiales bacterium]